MEKIENGILWVLIAVFIGSMLMIASDQGRPKKDAAGHVTVGVYVGNLCDKAPLVLSDRIADPAFEGCKEIELHEVELEK